MTFQEMQKRDLDDIFFNADELAGEHEIDGEKLTVILREEDYAGAKKYNGSMKSALNPKENAVNKNSLTLRIRESDVHRKLTAGAMITIDGKKMFISDVKHLGGVYVLTIERHGV